MIRQVLTVFHKAFHYVAWFLPRYFPDLGRLDDGLGSVLIWGVSPDDFDVSISLMPVWNKRYDWQPFSPSYCPSWYPSWYPTVSSEYSRYLSPFIDEVILCVCTFIGGLVKILLQKYYPEIGFLKVLKTFQFGSLRRRVAGKLWEAFRDDGFVS